MMSVPERCIERVFVAKFKADNIVPKFIRG
ncbi:MAG: hypothetical protein H6Q41_981 [Deltaproteobacteria bacterium]|nr:hypothetical protein [Deltaproteobacteria bacterium]